VDSTASSEAILDRLATALRTRVDAQRTAEMRLASFAFSEQPASGRTDVTSSAGDTPIDWRYYVLRALRVIAEPDSVQLLDDVRGDGRPLDELVRLFEPAARDRLAVGDRVGRLAAVGLVGRELASDRVSLTPLGEALLDLLADLERRAGARPR